MANDMIRLALLAIGASAIYLKRRQIAEAIENFRNNWPRGGAPPTHPLPAADDSLLRRVR
jgi:hypothetical protein